MRIQLTTKYGLSLKRQPESKLFFMSDDVDLPNLQGYVSIKTAAKMLGLSYKTVSEYVREGRMKAVLADNSLTLIPIEEVQNFKPNISGRPRTTVPKWRIAYDDNTLIQTSIFVQ